jgi:hypothetical protein
MPVQAAPALPARAQALAHDLASALLALGQALERAQAQVGRHQLEKRLVRSAPRPNALAAVNSSIPRLKKAP